MEKEPEVPQKTVLGVFSLVYAALNEAGKLCGDDSILEKTAALRRALDALPQYDLDALVQHITVSFNKIDNMRAIGIDFRGDAATDMVVATTHIQLGGDVLPLISPYDYDGAAGLLEQIRLAMGGIKKNGIIMLQQ
jgi:hypothetical protein